MNFEVFFKDFTIFVYNVKTIQESEGLIYFYGEEENILSIASKEKVIYVKRYNRVETK